MRRNSLLPIPLLLLAAGCRHGETMVYVDLKQILNEQKPLAPTVIPLPIPPTVRSSVVKTVPELPARELKDPSNTPQLNVAEMFRSEQAKALVTLQRRLRQYYDVEIQRFQLQQERSITGEQSESYKDALAKIRIEFEKWADERAPTYARLALIAGFPDPNPTSAA